MQLAQHDKPGAKTAVPAVSKVVPRHFSSPGTARDRLPLSPVCRPFVASCPLSCATPPAHPTQPSEPMPTAKVRASTILAEFDQAQTELVGKAVVLTDGKAGTIDGIWLDEAHGLRISIRGHEGRWPVSTIKFAQTDES